MIERCENENNHSFHNYGERGITVCKKWRNDFTAFCKWARENGYSPGLMIDRIDNDRGYSPKNCRWTDAKTQARNRRTNVVIEFQGESMTMIEWAETLGLEPHTLQKRFASGWSVERALTTPLVKCKSSRFRGKEKT